MYDICSGLRMALQPPTDALMPCDFQALANKQKYKRWGPVALCSRLDVIMLYHIIV